MAIRERTAFYLREWRQYRGLSLQKLADRLETSKGRIADLEKRVTRFNDDVLAQLAEALDCEPYELLMRNPLDERELWTVYDGLPAEDQQAVNTMIRALARGRAKPTGT